MEERTRPDWALLPSDVLEIVVSKLDFIDISRLGAVCHSWHAVLTSHRRFHPFLMIYSQENIVDNPQFWSPHEMNSMLYEPLKKKSRNLDRLLNPDCCVVGSSHGWVVILDKDTANLFLINPFSDNEIELPKKATLPHIHHFPQLQVYDRIVDSDNHSVVGDLFYTDIPVVQKAILSANPSSGKYYKVVIMYNFPAKLAFCGSGDKTWTALSDSLYYLDVVCYNNSIYAVQFTVEAGIGIDKWDLSSDVKEAPRKSSHIVIPSLTRELGDLIARFGDERYSVQFYLVPAVDETYLVARFVGTWNNADGILVGYTNLASDQNPYITLAFQVYKIDHDDQKKLVKVDSLAGNAMFVGRNQSIIVSVGERELGLKDNSIYFTDDDWEEVNAHRMYVGHDNGIYSLQDRSVNMLCELKRYKPVPFWVFPGLI